MIENTFQREQILADNIHRNHEDLRYCESGSPARHWDGLR